MKWFCYLCILAAIASAGCSKSNDPDVHPAALAFADLHWSDGPYWDSLLSIYGIEKWHDVDSFPHHLPSEIVGTDTVLLRNDEFYLNICKYDQFVWGWDDLAQVTTGSPYPEGNYASSNRTTYCNMRNQ